MYEQSLYIILKDHVKPKILKRNNKYKKWEYGYNEEHDFVVISKDGTVGDIYEIQGLKIGVPSKPKEIHAFEDGKWKRTPLPKVLKKIKSVFEWDKYPEDFKERWYDFIDIEFTRREEGFWFKNGDKDLYLTGTHYMYLQWSKIDVGPPGS